MELNMPDVSEGSGTHPITLVVITADRLSEASHFYSRLFGWQPQPMSDELSAVYTPGGPVGALRANLPSGFPAMVPYIAVADVEEALARVVAAGGRIEKETWSLPVVGKMARFKDPSGTLYGLTDFAAPGGTPVMPMPIGSNPKPPDGALCSIEMYAADRDAAAQFFGAVFGWHCQETMPQYTSFDPGAGIVGVFQSHTPSTPAMAYIYASDVKAKLAEIESADGKSLGEAMEVPGFACFGYFTDASNTAMGLIGPVSITEPSLP